MSIKALEGLTDEQLFSEANSDEAPAEAVAEPAGEPAEQDGQPRDDAGRFAGKPETPPETVAAAEPPARPQVDDNAPMVPSWRVREINEEKRTALAELETLRAERAQWQQRQQPPAPKPVEQPKAEEPDPLLDPKGYAAYVKEEARQELLAERREESLQNAREANPKEFDEAYAAAMQARDPGMLARVQASRNPGKALMDWHRERKASAEVGSDPNAYFDKRLEAFLADPANQAKVLDRIRGTVQPAPAGKPAPTSLPPSLTRATNAAAITAADDDDVSDDGLWRHANA
jgi:hypothetical protein